MFVFFLGDLFDSFGPNVPIDDLLDKMIDLTLIYVYIGLGLWVVSYIYAAIFGSVAYVIGKRYSIKYLESLLE